MKSKREKWYKFQHDACIFKLTAHEIIQIWIIFLRKREWEKETEREGASFKWTAQYTVRPVEDNTKMMQNSNSGFNCKNANLPGMDEHASAWIALWLQIASSTLAYLKNERFWSKTRNQWCSDTSWFGSLLLTGSSQRANHSLSCSSAPQWVRLHPFGPFYATRWKILLAFNSEHVTCVA